jgi:hypothetical protein
MSYDFTEVWIGDRSSEAERMVDKEQPTNLGPTEEILGEIYYNGHDQPDSTCFAMDSESIEAFEKLVKEVETGKLKFEKNIISNWLGENRNCGEFLEPLDPKSELRSPGSQ